MLIFAFNKLSRTLICRYNLCKNRTQFANYSYVGLKKSLNISKSNDITKKLPRFLNSAPKNT